MKPIASSLTILYKLQLRTIQRPPGMFCDEVPMPVLDHTASHPDLPVLGASAPAVTYVFAARRGTEQIAGGLMLFSPGSIHSA